MRKDPQVCRLNDVRCKSGIKVWTATLALRHLTCYFPLASQVLSAAVALVQVPPALWCGQRMVLRVGHAQSVAYTGLSVG